LKLLGPIKVLNSLCNVKKILFQKWERREGRNQKIIGNINNPKNELIQFRERLKILVEGSKIENKFIIIFNLKTFLN
jgi:hypothetical protein